MYGYQRYVLLDHKIWTRLAVWYDVHGNEKKITNEWTHRCYTDLHIPNIRNNM